MPPRSKASSTAAALKAQVEQQLGRVGKFQALTSRNIPPATELARRMFAQALSIGTLPRKLTDTKLTELTKRVVDVLKKTGHGTEQLAFSSVDELVAYIRTEMSRGEPYKRTDIDTFLGQHAGKESVVLGKLTERFVKSEENLQKFLRGGAEIHRDIVNTEIQAASSKTSSLIDGKGEPVRLSKLFEAPAPIRNIKRTVINVKGEFQQVDFFDHGYASTSEQDYWTFGSAQEIKTPGVARNISAQVALRDVRIENSVLIEFEREISAGHWKAETVNPEQIVSLPGSLVSVGITLNDSKSTLARIPVTEMEEVLRSQSQYKIVGRVERQRVQVTVGIPVSNLRAIIRAATMP